MVESRTIGVYGSLQKAYSGGLRLSEYYDRPDLSIAKRVGEKGIRYVPVIWSLETSNPSQGVVNIFGERRLFAINNSGCISNPEIRSRLLSTIEGVATKLEEMPMRSATMLHPLRISITIAFTFHKRRRTVKED